MKISALAILLIVGCACAAPEFDVAQGRIYDLWLQRMVDRFVNGVRDPIDVSNRDMNIVIIEGQLEMKATIENLLVTGGSRLRCDYAYYNFLLGRLDWRCVHSGITIELGRAEVDLIYGTSRGIGVASGRLEIGNINMNGNALLKHYSDGTPWIYNINAELGVERINADLNIMGSRDYSEQVNSFLNVRVPVMFVENKEFINTVFGEVIKIFVELYQSRN